MNILADLAETFRTTAVSKAYGGPVQVGGETLVPVALVQAGFGGGGDADGDGGGGAGGLVVPLGVYAGREGGPAVFRPNPVTLIAVMTPIVWILVRGLRRRK
ncbi:hypothetical protein [Arthrobacter luteolus]|uniref:hypothetical protein n=1 Tax=Arthrobacter luteolus TaxID=98672 RepID=UPI00083739C0|nr:hypothetical protein [Arthrobacter luteolus]